MTLCTEIFLQRTRADQVVPVFEEFQGLCREPSDVIEQGRDWVEGLFERLGLRWRAEHFWSFQETLIGEHGGKVPSRMNQLLDLPGVGRYSATATRVFAFGEPETVLDSNTLRIFGRYFGIEFPDHARRSPRVARWASEFAPEAGDCARRFNWGLIDFGAEVCTPSSPRCDNCPLYRECWYATHRTERNDLS